MVKEFPKWMHHAEQGSRIFNSQEDVDGAGGGWEANSADVKAEGDKPNVPQAQAEADEARARGLSPEQQIAALQAENDDLRRRQMASAPLPGTATPAIAREDAVEDHVEGHRGIEYATQNGNREIVADVDTMTRDNLQQQLRHFGIPYDERSTEKSLRAKLKAKVTDPMVSRAAASNPPNAEPEV